MYFNPLEQVAEPRLPADSPSPNVPSQVITVLTSRPSRPVEPAPLLQKKFWVDASGNFAEQAFQSAFLYDVETVSVSGIQEFGRLIENQNALLAIGLLKESGSPLEPSFVQPIKVRW